MSRILRAHDLAPGVRRFDVEAPRVTRNWGPGQFVILRLHERGERIPLTVAACDRDRGVITLVVQAVGKTTHELNRLDAGDEILDLAGPLGRPSDIKRFGHVAVVAGGVGAAIAWPVAQAMRAAGNEVTVVLGAKSAVHLLFENEFRTTAGTLLVATDDGSAGEHGLVTRPLARLLEARPPNLVHVVGPVGMMRAVTEETRALGIPTVASLNSIMVDGTGMCGGCRVLIEGESRLACIDGPEFDAHVVDFDVLARRNRAYRDQECAAIDAWKAREGER